MLYKRPVIGIQKTSGKDRIKLPFVCGQFDIVTTIKQSLEIFKFY